MKSKVDRGPFLSPCPTSRYSQPRKRRRLLFEVNLFHDQGHRCYILFVRLEKTRGAYDLAGYRDCLGNTSHFGTENSEFVAFGIGNIKRI